MGNNQAAGSVKNECQVKTEPVVAKQEAPAKSPMKKEEKRTEPVVKQEAPAKSPMKKEEKRLDPAIAEAFKPGKYLAVYGGIVLPVNYKISQSS